MKVVIDRFEGDYAICVCEDQSIIEIERQRIPQDAKESDVLNIEEKQITIDVELTKQKKKNIKNIMDDLWE